MRTPVVYARAARTLVAVMTVVSLLTPFAAARGAATCGTTTGNWTVIAGPSFPSGPRAITDLGIEARSPSHMFVTNGKSVMRSTDGGCSWQHSYTLGEGPDEAFTPATATIRKLVVPEAGGRVLLSVAETVVNQTRPHVVVSFDAGRSWESGDAGLPPLGSPEELVVASSSPDIGYLALDLGGGSLDSIFATADGGRSWQPRQQHIGGEFQGFEIDPIVPTEIWAWGQGLHRSTDGGQTFTPVDEFVGTTTGPVDAFHASGKPSDVMAFVHDVDSMKRSQDGGENWLDNYGLAAPDSIDHGVIADSRVATSQGRLWVWAPALYSWVDARSPVGGLTDVHASRSATASFYTHNATQVVIYTGETGADYEIPVKDFDIGDISLIDPDPAVVGGKPKLTPGYEKVKIAAGKTKRVRYGLNLSKVRTPLDLYFLIDTSESAKPFLKGLALVLEDIINELYAARLDVRFGLADYRAYPDSTPPRPGCDGADVPLVQDPECERNYVYRQVLDLPASSPQALATAIEGLVPIAGGHYNAPLPALHQAATGSGVDIWPNGMSDSAADGHDVQPGQEASFRDKALKVILNATDEEFVVEPYAMDDFPPDVPTFDEVIAALNARTSASDSAGIQQIGLALGTGAFSDLQRVAAGTGAVAPSQGADCDGNGSADIAAGQALVCTVQRGSLEEGSNLVPAIVNMVEAVRDTAPVTLEVEAKDDRVIADVTPDEYPGVVLQEDQDLNFDVTYECPMSMAGEKTKVVLSARQGPDPLAQATATVVCGDIAVKKKDFFDIYPIERVLGVLPLLPLSPPPTLANTSQATQAQSQAQAQGAMATQEQHQPQVALATQYKSALREAIARDEEYAMTRYRSHPQRDPAGIFLAAGATLMSAAYALAVIRRRRAPAFRRR